MSGLIRSVLALAVAVALVSPLAAQEAKKAEKKGAGKGQGRQAGAAAFQLPKEITLSAEQQAKLKALQAEYGPKLAAVTEKRNNLLSDEQKQARRAATKANQDAGKKGKEAQQAVLAATKVTPEQQTQFDALDAEQQKLRQEVQQKVRALLTPEQQAQLPQRGQGKKAAAGEKKPGAKKAKAAAKAAE